MPALPGECSILRNTGIDFVGPGEDTALQIQNLAEARFAQEIDSFGGALAAAAMRHDLSRRVEFMDAARQFPERNQLSVEIADLVFVRLAHIENEEIVAFIEPRLQFLWRDLWNRQIRRRGFFPAHAAEFVVVDQLMDGAMLAAHRAIRILAQLQFAELHSQRIEQQQPADETVTPPENQLDRLHRLNRSDDSREHTEHAALSARRHKSRRRRLGIEAAVARTIRHAKHSNLPLKPKNRSVNVRLAEQNARIVYEIPRRKIIGSVDDDVEILE